jgi:hydroxyacylglutathione hydrolase
VESINKTIFVVKNEIFPSNTYLLKSKSNNSCLIIDPGLDASLIDKKITELSLLPVGIISTHGHFDHIGSVSHFKKKFNIPFYMHEADLKMSRSANFYLKVAKINIKIETPTPDIFFKGANDSFSLNEFQLSIHNYPGHSEGSCILKYGHYLFSGDILYKKGLGFNGFPGENKTKLKQSILEIFSTFSGEHLILPGHGEPEYIQKIKNTNLDLINFLNLKAN